MLRKCAPGFTIEPKKHKNIDRFHGLTYPRFPRGPHGKRQNFGVEVGHVKSMVRFFGIQECAETMLEQLR
jgi:hypothetical protein